MSCQSTEFLISTPVLSEFRRQLKINRKSIRSKIFFGLDMWLLRRVGKNNRKNKLIKRNNETFIHFLHQKHQKGHEKRT